MVSSRSDIWGHNEHIKMMDGVDLYKMFTKIFIRLFAPSIPLISTPC